MGLNFFQMIKNILFLIFILFSLFSGFGQNQTKIEYRYLNFIKEYSSYDTTKQKTPGYEINKIIESLPFILVYDGYKSVFKIQERMGIGDKSIRHNQLTTMLPKTYIDFKNKTRYDHSEISGQTFLIKEKLNVDWKIINEKKIIKGYRCKKAIQFDENGNIKIEAWFAPEIPLSIGPSYYIGLPGLVISTKQFNNKGEAYAGFEVVNIDFSKQKKVNIPNHDTITEKEFTNLMRGSRKKFN